MIKITRFDNFTYKGKRYTIEAIRKENIGGGYYLDGIVRNEKKDVVYTASGFTDQDSMRAFIIQMRKSGAFK